MILYKYNTILDPKANFLYFIRFKKNVNKKQNFFYFVVDNIYEMCYTIGA